MADQINGQVARGSTRGLASWRDPVLKISLYQIEAFQVYTAISPSHIHFLISHAESIYILLVNCIQQHSPNSAFSLTFELKNYNGYSCVISYVFKSQECR